jgi:SAM-dependent methyltransferase
MCHTIRMTGHAAPKPDKTVTPRAILQIGMGYWASKTLLSAVELGLFTELAGRPRTLEALRAALGLHERGARDFLDALVALGLLTRENGHYANTDETALFLDRGKPGYIGGLLEMSNARLYQDWGGLTEALRTGRRQNENDGGGDTFATLYADPARLEGFLRAMTGASLLSGRAMAAAFPWREVESFIDVGCAQGGLTAEIALAHPHLSAVGFDLAPVGPAFERYIAGRGLSSRVRFRSGDFFAEKLPSADVIIMGHILHDWNLEEKRMLLRKAHDALPAGGRLIVYDTMIDDDRRANAHGLLMSLNMLIETQGGFDYTGADCIGWMTETGFHDAKLHPLDGPTSMVVGRK